MPKSRKVNLLVNLPPGSFKTPQLQPLFRRLAKRAVIRKRSFNTPEEIEKDLAWADAVIMWSWPVLSEELLAKAPKLRFAGHINISPAGAKAELKRGIAVSEARHGWSPAVAEMALVLTMSALRRISSYHAAMWAGKEQWVNDFPADIDPIERQLTGRAVGVIGFGGIGQRLAELLQPFHVSLRVYDPFVPAAAMKRCGAVASSLMDVMKSSEVVVLCASNTASSKSLVGRKQIAALRRNAILVNVGRSYLVDMKALYARVKKGEIAVALDVFDKEPLESNSPWRKLPNAYLSPHRAGAPLESVIRILTWLTEDFEAFLDGRKLKHTLPPAVIDRI